MTRVLITGASGLAGSYLARACADAGDDVVGISRAGALPLGGGSARSVDLTDAAAVRAAVADVAPEVVYHLAALSSVGRSWSEPAATLEGNVLGAIHLLEALRAGAPEATVVWASSCEVYGPPVAVPIGEEAPVNPVSPYAVSKAAAEQLAAVYAEAHGLRVIRVRPFSHSGPGQRSSFLLSSLARQGAQARVAGASELEVRTGRATTRRDFTDVRDIARAYRALAARGEPGLFNVCSGRSVSAGEQVALLAELLAPISVRHVVDPALVREHEIAELRGSHDRLTAATGWTPEIPLRETMAQTIAWWEAALSRAGASGAGTSVPCP